ncbi:sulfurtransferase [Winogradskyella litorisediminis]|uniref:Sulfurtransferase n=1 Tax=Winogradskyella litorisediminis TaxID=1156618 RepID=A0ABW3N2D5_9FLAO
MNNIKFKSPLVSAEWLQKHIEAENLLVLDATIPKVSGAILNDELGYIPKSQFFDIKQKFSDVSAELPNTLPSLEQFQLEARKLGINNSSAIVVYDQHGIYSSARAWWFFKYFGHENVAVLDGGLPEWISKGFQTVNDYQLKFEKGDFKANINSKLFTHFEGVCEFSNDKNTQIFDARSAKRFKGETPEPREGLPSGTITNSLNLPFTDLLDGNTLKSKDALKSIFSQFQIDNKKLVFSCGSGITACNLALGATIAGYKDLVVYDGSWTEYGTLKKE